MEDSLIGPTIPPGFIKKEKTTEDACEPDRTKNLSKTDLDRTEQDVIVGPILPSNFHNITSNDSPNKSNSSDYDTQSSMVDASCNSDDSEEYGPVLPDSLKNSIEKERYIGPTMPQNLNTFDDDEDDVVGPMPEGYIDKNHLYDTSKRIPSTQEKVSKREKWMLEPPKILSNAIPNKPITKSITKFSQKSKNKDLPLTEEQKLELEAINEKEERMKKFLQKYEKSNKRDCSLLDQHRKELKKTKKQKPEKYERREFDREKDLNVPKMDAKSKNSFFKEASSTFGSRFSKGKFEKFL